MPHQGGLPHPANGAMIRLRFTRRIFMTLNLAPSPWRGFSSRWNRPLTAPTRALQAYLGHKNIQHTVRYTELSPTRFKDFWR